MARPLLGLVALSALLLGPSAAYSESTPNGSAHAGTGPIPIEAFSSSQTNLPTTEDAWDIPGVVLIDTLDDLGEADEASLLQGLRSHFPDVRFEDTDLERQTGIHVAVVSPDEEAALIAESSRDSRVEGAEPLAWVAAQFVPNDPLYKDQWHMKRVGAESAWDFATGRGVTVAVVDTGIACENHGPFTKGTDLASTQCVEGWNLVANNTHANDDQGHGSHVAGTIAQSTNNGIGAVGLAFDARLMPVKVLNASGFGTTADVADGIRWAADHGAQVINLSLGGPRNSKVLQDAVDHARKQGAIVVAAAGNSGGAVGYPGGCVGAVGVSATDPDDKLAKFSSRGPEVDIAAPGVNVVQQTICEGGKNKCEVYPGYSGTSMASPHVAGAAALLVSLGVSDPDAIEQKLEGSARVVDDSAAGKKLYGAGILDAANAVRKVTFEHAAMRLGMLLGLSLLVSMMARRKNAKSSSPLRPAFVLGGLLAGPGLLFFAPLVLSRVHLGVDLLSRPLGDLDLYVGASLHKLLPLANALVPAVLTAVTFHSKPLRLFTAGIAVGTAAYLGSVAVLAESAAPFGSAALSVWCAVNAIGCMLIARLNLAEAK